MTEADLERLAEDLEAEAEAEGVRLWHTIDGLRYRLELLEEEEGEEDPA